MSERLTEAGVPHTVCLATEYGGALLDPHPPASVRLGRMDRAQMEEYIREGRFDAVVDATHPYAALASENSRAAALAAHVQYLRIKRDIDVGDSGAQVHYFDNPGDCAAALARTDGNILLTTGSKELEYFTSEISKERIYARVLPSMESLEMCGRCGIPPKQVIAMQGPFSAELNEAVIRQCRISHLVTKAGGRAGGYEEKLVAAGRAGIPVYIIGASFKDEGVSFREACGILGGLCGVDIPIGRGMEIVLAGVGMGADGTLTAEARREIASADVILGAERLIAPYCPRVEKKAIYAPGQVTAYLIKMQEDGDADIEKAAVLFSGDSGFYSGCRAVYQALMEAVGSGRLDAKVRILPGVSSVSYLAARLGEPYDLAEVLSMHGRTLPNLARRIRSRETTFLLLSGVGDLQRLGNSLLGAGLGHCRIFAGYRLSYPDERILSMTPEECRQAAEEGLYTCCVKNPHPMPRRLTHGLADDFFIRGKVPMTKEEIREVGICKLRPREGDVLYDIGSGTGSLAVEIAGLSDNVTVYAIEKKDDAFRLIEKNKEKSGLDNIEPVHGEAPEAFADLPVPERAVIGGSGGRLGDILAGLYRKNPSMRLVIHAVSIETLCAVQEAVAAFPVKNDEIVQVMAARSRKAGGYHMMSAENPVWICSFDFCGKEAADED